MRYFRRVLIALLILLPIGLVGFALNVFYGIDDAYAQWGAVDMVIRYMEAHDGRWPPNWEALRADIESGGGRLGGSSFAHYRKHVVIDFDVDADELRKQSVNSEKVTFNVIRARWTFGVAFGEGPNASLHAYFRRKAGIIEAPRPHGDWPSKRHKAIADRWYQRGFFVRFDEHGNVVAIWTHLYEARSDDRDVSNLRELQHLNHVNLVGSHVTDDGLKYLKELPVLEKLEISDGITDAGLAQLSGLSALVSLDLFGTQITDAGLQHLRQIKTLRTLRVDESRISQDALRDLVAAVPGLEIQSQLVLTAPGQE